MKRLKFPVVAGLVVLCGVSWGDTKTTYRDASGRIQGTVSTDRNGKTIYRDSQGRIQGTSSTDRYGKTIYRDSQGRIQGSKK